MKPARRVSSATGRGSYNPAPSGSPVRHLQKAGHHPRRLPQWQLEQNLIVRQNWIAGSENTAGRPRRPSCRASQVISLFQPDQQRAALAQRAVVIGPVCCAVAGGCWLAHTVRLTAWIHDVNPPRSELRNSAAAMQHRQKAQCRTGAFLCPTTKPNDLTLRISPHFVPLSHLRNSQ